MGVAAQGQYAYVAVDDAEVLILDISTPAQPVWRRSFNVGAWPSGVAAAGNHLYVTHGKEGWMAPWQGGGLVILDITQPLNPVQVGALESGYSSEKYPDGRIQLVGDFAYLTWLNHDVSSWGLDVIDIRNPAQPVRIGSLEITEQISDFDFAGDHAYVATGGGFWVIDLRNPAQPAVAIANFGEGVFKWSSVAAAGNHAYLTAGDRGLAVLDVSNPANPRTKSFYSEFTNGGRPIQIAGNYAYLQTSQGFDVIDVSDPTHLTRVGRCVGPEGGRFQIVGNYGYSPRGEGMQVINFTDPVNPVIVGGFSTVGETHQVRVVGSRAYLADGNAIQVLDVSDPGHPVSVGSLGCGAYTLDVAGLYAYVAGFGPLTLTCLT